jgi:hypothetical protein
VGVYHLGQSPVGTVKDSITDYKDLTPGGSMTNSDLIYGQDSPAIEFDGSDDKLYTSSVDYSALETAHTVEFKVNWVSASNYERVLQIGPDTAGSIIPGHRSTSGYYLNGVWSDDNESTLALTIGGWDSVAYKLEGGNIKVYGGGVKDPYENSVTMGNLSSTPLTIGGTISLGYHGNHKLEEVRISKVARSDDWINTTYYSNMNEFVTYSGVENAPSNIGDPVYSFWGYIKEYTEGVPRKVRAYRADTGELMASTESDLSGYYYMTTAYAGTHYLVCLDDPAAPDFNHQIIKEATPYPV